DRLLRNVRESIADLGDAQVRHAFGRILVDSPAEEAALISRLRKVFGIVSLSPVRVVAPAFPDIASAAVDMVGAALAARSRVGSLLAARRGMTIIPVHCYSFPFTSERSKEKVLDLCRVLAGYAGPLRVWIVFFTDIQRTIQLSVPEGLRVLVMRRMMMRLVERLAEQERAAAVVTGESLGQVASQTIESIAAINAVTRLPVLR